MFKGGSMSVVKVTYTSDKTDYFMGNERFLEQLTYGDSVYGLCSYDMYFRVFVDMLDGRKFGHGVKRGQTLRKEIVNGS